MKIILTQEVSGLGTPGDIVEVKDGYGRNYLLPQGFAIGWTKGAREAGHARSSGPGRPARSATSGHANEVKAQLEGLKVDAVRPRRQRRPAVRLGHPDRDRRGGQGRRRPGPRPAPARAARPHQVGRPVPGPGRACTPR